jgi:hypothetical protein
MSSINIVDNVAQFIRTTDYDNNERADLLGWKIAEHLTTLGRPVSPTAVAAYVQDINATKQLSAGRLAELITNRFDITY